MDAAEKRVKRCKTQAEGAQTRFDGKPDSEELDLRNQLAKVNLRLAEIELEEASAKADGAPEDSDEDVTSTPEEVVPEGFME